MASAEWSVSVPTRHVDDAGTVQVVAQVTDAVSGETGTVTVTLTADRQLTCLADGIVLANYQAWST